MEYLICRGHSLKRVDADDYARLISLPENPWMALADCDEAAIRHWRSVLADNTSYNHLLEKLEKPQPAARSKGAAKGAAKA